MKTIFYKLILCLALFITLFFLYKPQINNKIYKGKEKDVYVSVEMNQEVHQILLDDYLLGVVAGEMPASFELEAIKAQVVASRTFVYSRLLSVDNTTNTQVYLDDEKMKVSWNEHYEEYKEKEFSKTSLKQMFNGSFNYQILSYYPSGRIQTIKINNQNYTGRQMREKLQLASSDFTIVEKSDSYVFKTKGSGHGVGLSQYGAQGMAKEGYDYQQILKHYYQGVEISKNN